MSMCIALIANLFDSTHVEQYSEYNRVWKVRKILFSVVTKL